VELIFCCLNPRFNCNQSYKFGRRPIKLYLSIESTSKFRPVKIPARFQTLRSNIFSCALRTSKYQCREILNCIRITASGINKLDWRIDSWRFDWYNAWPREAWSKSSLLQTTKSVTGRHTVQKIRAEFFDCSLFFLVRLEFPPFANLSLYSWKPVKIALL
jgi:hypothetical protein